MNPWSGPWYLLAFVISVALGVSSSLTLTDPRNSFARFEKWEGSLLRFRFKTYLTDALLLYQDSGEAQASDVFAVELSGGQLSISVNSRRGARAVKIGKRLNDLKWHTVALERINKHQVNISLDSGVLQETILSYKQPWKTLTSLYFGGLPSTDFGGKRFVLPSILNKNRFVGCVEGPEFSKDMQGSLRNATLLDSKGVVNGCTNFCDKGHDCLNGGTCVNKFITAECDCRHTAFEGSRCKHESLTVNLQTMDYITYQIPPATTLQDRVTFRFKTSKSEGVLLETSFYYDFLVVKLKSGSVHVTWNLGAKDLALSTGNRRYDDETWHFTDIQRDLRHISLSVDDTLDVSWTFPGRFVGFDMKGGRGKVFIGRGNSVRSTITADKQNFQGCLQKLTFNGVNVLRGLQIGTKGYSLHGTTRWNCDGTVAMVTVGDPLWRSGNQPTSVPPNVVWEKSAAGRKQKVHPPSLRGFYWETDSPTLHSVDGEDDCIHGAFASGSGQESSGDSRDGESGSGCTTATSQPTVNSSPQESSSTACSSDDEDCGGSGKGAEGGSGRGNTPSQGVHTSSVVAAKGREGQKETQVQVIASVAVVAFLLAAFLMFVGVWCYKHGGKGYSLSRKKLSVNLYS